MATLRKVYLDNAATTPLSPAARAVYQNDELMSTYGNPSSLHFEGVKAARLLDESRIVVLMNYFLHLALLNPITGF